MLKVINLWAGPGAGKSTTSAHLFALMKARGHKVELLHECAKPMVYAGHLDDLQDALWVFANEARKQRQLEGQVEWVITDAPLPLTLAYGDSPGLAACIKGRWDRYDNRNFFITREKPYQAWGRRARTVEEARGKDREVFNLVVGFCDSLPVGVPGNEEAAETIYGYLFPNEETNRQQVLRFPAPYHGHVTPEIEEVLYAAGLSDPRPRFDPEQATFEAAWRHALD